MWGAHRARYSTRASGSFSSSFIFSLMRLSISSKDGNSLEDMDIIAALTPKNMTVREIADVTDTSDKAFTYVFNSREYTHVGKWPMNHGTSGFHVPIETAEVIETNQDITKRLKRFAGPRNIIRRDTVRYAMGTWSWRPRITFTGFKIRMTFAPVLIVPTYVPPVRITNVLGHVSSFFCAK